MIEVLKYRNHVNEEILIGQGNIFLNYSDLHDYAWNTVVSSNRISSFRRDIMTLSLPLVIVCQTEAEGLQIKNRILEVCEKDVLAKQYGKLIVGNYYLNCYVTGSKKSSFLMTKGAMKATLQITTDLTQWVKETTTEFRSGVTVGSSNGVTTTKRNFDYNFDFPYDYTSEMMNKKLINTGFVGTNFRIVIYGASVNPSIHIAGHEYSVNCSVGSGEYLTIDSLNKTIYLTQSTGTKVNKFNSRERSSYIFQTIPPGENSVTWAGGYGFDVTLLEERSEPKWI